MKSIFIFACVFHVLGTLAAESSSGAPQGVQIITPVNHSFVLKLNNLQQILDVHAIKDRHVVIVSIAGAFRQGKSFLLNFFIKYLNAEYKKHDISDWMGERDNSSKLNGFTWRGDRKPETIGIWMWSEVFTHDFENGEKVAIILLDTQGIFDSNSSVRDCTTIFALSTMLSSVQCYNLMYNIQENDLQHLELFTEYGRLALEQSSEKPFQSLVFIVRDWPYEYETDYGWAESVIDKALAANDEQTPGMRQLRARIRSSFEKINAFLFPHPGFAVAQGKNFTGDLQQIHPDFRKYVKELAPALFAPQNLIVKKINGQKVRVRDLITYIQSYTKVFNGNTLPEPKTIFMGTAEAGNQILYTDCVNAYVQSMQNLLTKVDPFYSQTELKELHGNRMNNSLAQFLTKPKLGGPEMISNFSRRIESSIEEHFKSFQHQNEEKRKNYIEKTNLHNEKMCSEIKVAFEKTILNGTENMNAQNLDDRCKQARLTALERFDAEKMGDIEVSNRYREKLLCDLKDLQSIVEQILASIKLSLNMYGGTMTRGIHRIWSSPSLSKPNWLMEVHQNAKRTALAEFEKSLTLADDELASHVRRKIDNEIETNHSPFGPRNVRLCRTYFIGFCI